MEKEHLKRGPDIRKEHHEWGEMYWIASEKQGNSDGVALIRCKLLPDCAIVEHAHAGGQEIVHVVEGWVRTIVGKEGGEYELDPGDTLTVPAGAAHRIDNIGGTEAVLLFVLSNPGEKAYAPR